MIEVSEQGANGAIEVRETEERVVAQPGQDPAFDEQDAGFDLGFVPGLVGPGGQNGGAVMGGEFGISGVEFRLVPAGGGDSRLQVVRDDELGDPTKEGEG